MKDDKIGGIIKAKAFSNFWICFDYLLMAGYDEKEALGYSLDEFGEDGVFVSVAYIGMETIGGKKLLEPRTTPNLLDIQLRVGLFNEHNKGLSRMYDHYRTWGMKDESIEGWCDKLTFNNLKRSTIELFLALSTKHYGFAAFKPIYHKDIVSRLTPPLIISKKDMAKTWEEVKKEHGEWLDKIDKNDRRKD